MEKFFINIFFIKYIVQIQAFNLEAYKNKKKTLTLLSAKAEMTFPRADKDLLIFLASSNTAPSAPVLLTYTIF